MVFIHPQALCESNSIGKGTRIWAFAHILPQAVIGEDCNICDHVFIENQVSIGDRVTIKSGVQLWDGAEIESDVFIGPNVTFTNDLWPRSRQYPESYLKTIIRHGASIGANATLLAGIEIGPGAMIGAGSVVTRSVPAHAVVVGNPARITGYAETGRDSLDTARFPPPQENGPARIALGVADATLHRMSLIRDLRGDLSVGEIGSDVPFTPQRYFTIFNVPSEKVRGEHAHKQCHQFLICLKGSVSVVVEDGSKRRQVTLDAPDIGLYVPPMVWSSQFRHSADAVLLVFASHPYDPDDYIREYSDFISAVSSPGCPASPNPRARLIRPLPQGGEADK